MARAQGDWVVGLPWRGISSMLSCQVRGLGLAALGWLVHSQKKLPGFGTDSHLIESSSQPSCAKTKAKCAKSNSAGLPLPIFLVILFRPLPKFRGENAERTQQTTVYPTHLTSRS